MIVLAVEDPVDGARVEELCERAAALLAPGCGELICDVHAVERPDAATVEALARLQLVAKRLGRDMRIRGASDQLRALIAFMGLRGVLRLEARR